MSLDKAIRHGKERRKPYYRSQRFDRTCRNHGSCPYCAMGRMHKHKRREPLPDDYTTRAGQAPAFLCNCFTLASFSKSQTRTFHALPHLLQDHRQHFEHALRVRQENTYYLQQAD